MTLVSGSAGIGKSTMGLQFLLEGAKRKERGIYVTLEEGQAQILNSADVVGLPLRKAVKQGLVEIVYLSRELVRAGQFLTLLADKIEEKKALRLVLDSASQVVNVSSWKDDELRQLLYKLVMRFKALGVTSLFTLESKSLFLTDSVTERDFSPIADNLLMLRYVRAGDRIDPSLTIVKTRSSKHERNAHVFDLGKGGMRIGPRIIADPQREKESRNT
jgi:circadian clock protein KaiC